MDAFVGTYKLDKHDNFGNYLKEKGNYRYNRGDIPNFYSFAGVNFLLRQIITRSSQKVEITKLDDDKYRLLVYSPAKTVNDFTFKLGEEFEGANSNSKMAKITFSLDEQGVLTRKLEEIESKECEVCEYRKDGDKMTAVSGENWIGVDL